MRPFSAFTLALAGVIAVACAASVRADVFNTGDLAVFLAGDGVAPLSNTGNQINIMDLSRAGAVRQTFAVPTAVVAQGNGWASNSGLLTSGSAASEGQINLSTDGHSLTFAGYIANPGTYTLSSATAAQVQRGYGSIDASGNYTFGGTFGNVNAYRENNIRGAVTDGTHVWGAGANKSPYYGGTMVGLGNNNPPGTEVQLDGNNQNTRDVEIFGGNLFYSTQKGTDGIHYYNGLPTSDSPTDHLLIGTGDTDSVNDFAISPGAIMQTGSHVYIADARASSSGGVQRWDWIGSSYSLSYTMTLPGNVGGLEGLAVDFSTNEIFTTTSTNIYAVTDLGSASQMTSIYNNSDTMHYAFRGISLAPSAGVPEPSSIVLAVVAGLFGPIAFAWRRRKSAS